MRMEMVLGWGEEEGEMEVDNQFPSDCAARWICNECGMEAPKVWPHQYKKNNNHNTDWQKTITALSGFLQGYQDIVNEKVASAIAKLEEAGLTPEACEKFLKTYGKVILNFLLNAHIDILPSFLGSPIVHINILPSVQVLHPNHAHMLDIKYSYLNILGHSEGWE